MIETEKATDALDLPHAFRGAGRVCDCGRGRVDELHQASAREVAQHDGDVLARETGS